MNSHKISCLLLTLFIGTFNGVAAAGDGSGGTAAIDPNLQTLASAWLFPPMHDEQDAKVTSAKRVDEEMYVTIGGIEQWITIKGDDRANPVVLVLHGGPGDALSPFADALFAGWDKDFTLVQWDQRGAGRTFGKTGPSIAKTLTTEQMVRDGIEVAEYLTKHLGKPKIILTGGSWGSILGIYMAHARPDLFYAYVGSAQMVNWPKNMSDSYARLMQMAEAANDKESIEALRSIGPPVWQHLFPWWTTFQKVKGIYQTKVATAEGAPIQISSAYASAAEREQYSKAEFVSFLQFWAGRQLESNPAPADYGALPFSGPLLKVDLPALGTEFKISIYMVQGAADLHALPELAKAYFDSIKAPHKEFYLVPGTGHEPSVALMNLIRKILVDKVRPLAK